MGGRRWTPEELAKLENGWGVIPVPSLADALGRSEISVARKAYTQGLGPWLMGGDYITVRQLALAFGTESHSGDLAKAWARRGLPTRCRMTYTRWTRVVKLEDFWPWARENVDVVDFSRLPKNGLGIEPEWVDAERARRVRAGTRRHQEWTETEVSRLEALAMTGAYSTDDLARELGRTAGAVYCKLKELRLGYTVAVSDGHRAWSDAEMALLRHQLARRTHLDEIHVPGRSAASVRGQMYKVYRTTSARKAWALAAKEEKE